MDNNTYITDSQFIEDRYARVLDMLYMDMLYKQQVTDHETIGKTVSRYQTVSDITHYNPPANNNQELYKHKAGLFAQNQDDALYVSKKDMGLGKVLHLNAYAGSSMTVQFQAARRDFQSNVSIMFAPAPALAPPAAVNTNTNPDAAPVIVMIDPADTTEALADQKASNVVSMLYWKERHTHKPTG